VMILRRLIAYTTQHAGTAFSRREILRNNPGLRLGIVVVT
jgi:hypothetical protein